MTGLLSQVPGRLLGALLLAVPLVAGLTALLTWHAVRRVFDVPRVPRPPAMYVVLGGCWLALVLACTSAIGAIALLRDYRSVDRPTPLAQLRCAALGDARVRLELQTGSSAAPEHYDVAGDSCIVWVDQVELRPGLQPFGIRALSRVESVGSVARPANNPDWLTPRPPSPRGFMSLVVRRAARIPIVVPRDAEARLVLSSSPAGPTIQQSPI